MQRLLNRLEEITHLSYLSPLSADRLIFLLYDVKSIMNNCNDVLHRADLKQLITEMKDEPAPDGEHDFIELKYRMINRIQNFCAACKQKQKNVDQKLHVTRFTTTSGKRAA